MLIPLHCKEAELLVSIYVRPQCLEKSDYDDGLHAGKLRTSRSTGKNLNPHTVSMTRADDSL